jgi:hypothetical protein
VPGNHEMVCFSIPIDLWRLFNKLIDLFIYLFILGVWPLGQYLSIVNVLSCQYLLCHISMRKLKLVLHNFFNLFFILCVQSPIICTSRCISDSFDGQRR